MVGEIFVTVCGIYSMQALEDIQQGDEVYLTPEGVRAGKTNIQDCIVRANSSVHSGESVMVRFEPIFREDFEEESEDSYDPITNCDFGEIFNSEYALAKLLQEEILFCNSFDISREDCPQYKSHTVVMFVNCNDLFEWGCCDSESFQYSEIRDIWDAWSKSGRDGVLRWIALKRKCRPQSAIEKEWKAIGFWDSELEALER